MPRKKTKSLKRPAEPDIIYQNVLVTRMINKVMQSGKKRLAERLVYNAMDEAAKKVGQDPLEVMEAALKNASPQLEVKSKRVGGANYQVPIEVRGDRKLHLAMGWIITAAQSKSGKSFDLLLANELIDAYNNTGDAIKKKQDTHAAAEANKAFAHFARF